MSDQVIVIYDLTYEHERLYVVPIDKISKVELRILEDVVKYAYRTIEDDREPAQRGAVRNILFRLHEYEQDPYFTNTYTNVSRVIFTSVYW